MRSITTLVVAVATAMQVAVAPTQTGCGSCDLEITTPSLPDGVLNSAYAFELDSDCGGDFWFVSDGNLPPGIGLIDDGVLRGTPTVAGSFNFTIGVLDESGDRAFKGFSMTIVEAT